MARSEWYEARCRIQNFNGASNRVSASSRHGVQSVKWLQRKLALKSVI